MTPLYSAGKAVFPNHRWGHSGCTLKDPYIFLFGGYSDSKYFNDTWVYNWTTAEWINLETDGNSSCPDPRSNSTIVYDAKKDRVILFGGGSASNVRHNDIWIMDMKQFYEAEQEEAEKERQKQVKTDKKYLHKFKPQWKLDFKADQQQISQAPWPRTYHAGILIDNYLLIHGGQGYGSDLDDLWCFNLQTRKWKQIKTTNTPKGRRFHTGVRVGHYFYIVGGCYDGYNCLSDIHRINLYRFVKKQKELALLEQNFSTMAAEEESYQYTWQCINMIDKGIFVPRWGHMACAIDNNIYIYGGRSYNDHNDLLLLQIHDQSKKNKFSSTSSSIKSMNSNPQLRYNSTYSTDPKNDFQHNDQKAVEQISPFTQPMRISKLRNSQTPKGRRRGCMWVVGSCIVLHGGFNGNYFDDMSFINMHQTVPLTFDQLQLNEDSIDRQNVQESCDRQLANPNIKANEPYPRDIHIYTSDQKILHLRTKDIRYSFTSEEKMVQFIEALAEYTFQQALQYGKILKTGIFDEGQNQITKKVNKDILAKYCIIYGGCVLSACQRRLLCSGIQEDILVTHNNPLRALKVSRGQIERIFKEIQTDKFNDISLHCTQLFSQKPRGVSSNAQMMQTARPFKANSHSLSRRSLYFSGMLRSCPFYRKQPIILSNIQRQGQGNMQIQNYESEQTLFSYKLLLIYMHYGHIVLPHCFTLEQMLRCYQLAEMYLIEGARRIILQEIMHRINSSNDDPLESYKNQTWASLGWEEDFNKEKSNKNNQKSKYYPGYMQSIVEFCLKGADRENLSKILEMAVGKIIIDAAKNTSNHNNQGKAYNQKKEQTQKEGNRLFSFANLSAVLCMSTKKPSQSTNTTKRYPLKQAQRTTTRTPNSLKNLKLRKQSSEAAKQGKENLPSLRNLSSTCDRLGITQDAQQDYYYNPYEMQRKAPSEADYEFQLELQNVMETLNELQTKYDHNLYTRKGGKRQSSKPGRRGSLKTTEGGTLGQIVNGVKDLYKLEIAFWRVNK